MRSFPVQQAPSRRRSRDRTVVECACGTVTDQGRKGQCLRCAIRRSRGAELGAACAVCEESDRRTLCRRELAGESSPVTLCGSCAVLLGRRALTLSRLRAERLGTEAPRSRGPGSGLLDELLAELGAA